MKIWKLSNDYKYRIGVKNFQQDYYLYFDPQFKGEPIEKWGEVQMEIKKGAGKKTDTFDFISGKPIFSIKAVDILSDLLKSHVEILPLKHEPFPIVAVNVLNVVDGIDQEMAEKKLLPNGTFVGYEKYAFIKEMVAGHHIFKIPQQLSTMVFVSDEFKHAVEKNKLKGFAFNELWNSEAENSEQRVAEFEEVPLTLTYGEAMEIVEQGEKAVVNGNDKWQKANNGKVLLGHRMPDGSYKWMEPIYVPIPHLLAKWGIAEKSDI